MTAAPYRVAAVNPGHFHAALCLRERHPRLDDEVLVYGEEGADLQAFLDIVDSFNARAERPTAWRLTVYRGPDYLDRLIADKAADVAIIAGRNGPKMAAIHRLHQAGLHVLADKPLLVDAAAWPLLEESLTGPPLVMEIMTGRQDPANRLTQALTGLPEVFGGFRYDEATPAISYSGAHHLYKVVNGAPLIRPTWYFDHTVAGEGITDVTTHIVDLAQWLIGNGEVELQSARQWPTEVPLDYFSRITGHTQFPAALAERVEGDTLHYLGNAALRFRLNSTPVEIESLWALEIPEGGGDTHKLVARGSKATVVNEESAATGFESRVTVTAVDPGPNFDVAVNDAVAGLQKSFPGLQSTAKDAGYELVIPSALQTTHEEHFAEVLNRFVSYIDAGAMPADAGPRLLAKYRLLMDAKALSHARH